MEKINVYIETYGCQMNTYDSEIIGGILTDDGNYEIINSPDSADVILLNTCSVRENAENTIYKRLMHLKHYRKSNRDIAVGIIGCMAERLRKDVFEKSDLVKIVMGPDEYRKAPELIRSSLEGNNGIAVKLSRVETYEYIEPLRTEGVSAWLAIMRGCNHFCTYCVVPFTRGRERSRSKGSIINEIQKLEEQGFKEVILLGQNVNSYKDLDSGTDFPNLLRTVAEAAPSMRIRFLTSHPIDMSDDLIYAISEYDNICNYIHLPFQSGSDRILQLMNRQYSRAHYLERIAKIKEIIPDCSLSTDIIAGFPTETLDDHLDTLSLISEVEFDSAFMFKYSPREGTKAWNMEDDVPDDVKSFRLNEIINIQKKISNSKNQVEIGKIFEILVERSSKKNPREWMGRTKTNKVVILDNHDLNAKAGDILNVQIDRANSATLFGTVV
ncbi:MAG TPA: tRNA (N6-isopentenyl adenosine(37)-C2)-methylthiotransferase MiaB [Bacteroidetes bacterium]|nr:tRNA (N6-isopentenyl adenosine(37)-C2)-methylthiotransferase MiaB [Bacteroidota bacterium]